MSDRPARPLLDRQAADPAGPARCRAPRPAGAAAARRRDPVDRRGGAGRVGQDQPAQRLGRRPGRPAVYRVGVARRERRRAGPVLELRAHRAARRRRRRSAPPRSTRCRVPGPIRWTWRCRCCSTNWPRRPVPACAGARRLPPAHRSADPRGRRVPGRLPAAVAAAGDRRPRRPAAADRPAAGPGRADRAARRRSAVVPRRGGGAACRPCRERTLDDARAAAVWERTEGWAAGLQLAGAGPAGRHRPTRSPSGCAGTIGTCSTTSPRRCCPPWRREQRDLLVRAAPLERLSGSLCDAALQVDRFRGGAGRARPGRPVPGRPRRRARVVPLPPAVPRRAAARARGAIGVRHRRCCAARPTGSSGRAGSTKRSGTFCGPGRRRRRRDLLLLQSRSRGSSSAGRPPPSCCSASCCPHRRSRPAVWRSRWPTPRPRAGDRDRVRALARHLRRERSHRTPSSGAGAAPAPPRCACGPSIGTAGRRVRPRGRAVPAGGRAGDRRGRAGAADRLAALGSALARDGRFDEAAAHPGRAVAARADQLLVAAGDPADRRQPGPEPARAGPGRPISTRLLREAGRSPTGRTGLGRWRPAPWWRCCDSSQGRNRYQQGDAAAAAGAAEPGRRARRAGSAADVAGAGAGLPRRRRTRLR